MKIALVRLANHLLPGGLLLVGSGVAYTLLRSLRNGTNLLEMGVAFSILAGLLTSVLGFAIWAASYADTALKRDMFRRRLAELWERQVIPFDNKANSIFRALRQRQFPDQMNGTCWSFCIDTAAFPRYESQGYILVNGTVVHMAMVCGVRGRWHIDCYLQAACEREGAVFTVQSVCGPLKSWVAQGSEIGIDFEEGNEGLAVDSIGLVRMFRSGVPKVLARFAPSSLIINSTGIH